jgi:hypothetical protein
MADANGLSPGQPGYDPSTDQSNPKTLYQQYLAQNGGRPQEVDPWSNVGYGWNGAPIDGVEGQYGRAAQGADDRNAPGNQQYYQGLENAYGAEYAEAQRQMYAPYGAQQQYQRGLNQAQTGLNSQSQARGGGNPVAARSAIYAGGQMQAQGVGEGQLLRQQEQAQRDAAMFGVLGNRAQYEQMARDDATRRYAGNLGYESDYRQQQAEAYRTDKEREAAEDANSREWFSAVAGMIGGGAGGGAMASDERNKVTYDKGSHMLSDRRSKVLEARVRALTAELAKRDQETLGKLRAAGPSGADQQASNIAAQFATEDKKTLGKLNAAKPRARSAAEMDAANTDAMRQLDSQAWQYKPEFQREQGLTPRMQFGPMAQDLEKNPITASTVYDTPSGKVVDTKALSMQQAGMLGTLARRMDRLEQQGVQGGGASGGEYAYSDKRVKVVYVDKDEMPASEDDIDQLRKRGWLGSDLEERAKLGKLTKRDVDSAAAAGGKRDQPKFSVAYGDYGQAVAIPYYEPQGPPTPDGYVEPEAGTGGAPGYATMQRQQRASGGGGGAPYTNYYTQPAKPPVSYYRRREPEPEQFGQEYYQPYVFGSE